MGKCASIFFSLWSLPKVTKTADVTFEATWPREELRTNCTSNLGVDVSAAAIIGITLPSFGGSGGGGIILDGGQVVEGATSSLHSSDSEGRGVWQTTSKQSMTQPFADGFREHVYVYKMVTPTSSGASDDAIIWISHERVREREFRLRSTFLFRVFSLSGSLHRDSGEGRIFAVISVNGIYNEGVREDSSNVAVVAAIEWWWGGLMAFIVHVNIFAVTQSFVAKAK